MIKTPITNIKTETILRPISTTAFQGINGGFFEGSYTSPPTSGRSISWSREDIGETVTFEGKTLWKNYDYNGTPSSPGNHKTMVLYNDDGILKAHYMYARTINDVFNRFGSNNVMQAIGGRDYNIENWGALAYHGYTQRTVLMWEGNTARLITTGTTQNIWSLKIALEALGYDPVKSIVLDGSGSTAMQVYANGTWDNSYYGGNRYIFNMIRLINAY